MHSYFGAPGDPPDEGDGQPQQTGSDRVNEDLPYRVEVWDASGAFVEQVVALTANRTVGWAAYFATKEQFPRRRVTFRDQFGELGRWDAKNH